ncbi:hypothetical protein BgiBS90_034090 [Biomphalaria glabrata]|nr:hypothetical protein BgiBS90_034090 [Biomphalaria glabrata]
MEYLICVFIYLSYCGSFVCSGVISTTKFLDRVELRPVGCSEVMAWKGAKSSKIMCALVCVAHQTCVAFSYSQQTTKCLVCHGDLITNLTFTGNEKFTFPNQILQTSARSNLNVAINKIMQFPNGLHVGSLIHLTVALSLFEPKPTITIRLLPADQDVDMPLKCVFQDREVNVAVKSSLIQPIIRNFSIGPLLKNATHTVDILVTKGGYNIYFDKSYCCYSQHYLPLRMSRYIKLDGSFEILELAV